MHCHAHSYCILYTDFLLSFTDSFSLNISNLYSVFRCILVCFLVLLCSVYVCYGFTVEGGNFITFLQDLKNPSILNLVT